MRGVRARSLARQQARCLRPHVLTFRGSSPGLRGLRVGSGEAPRMSGGWIIQASDRSSPERSFWTVAIQGVFSESGGGSEPPRLPGSDVWTAASDLVQALEIRALDEHGLRSVLSQAATSRADGSHFRPCIWRPSRVGLETDQRLPFGSRPSRGPFCIARKGKLPCCPMWLLPLMTLAGDPRLLHLQASRSSNLGPDPTGGA